MILERVAKGSRLGFAIEVFAYVIFGGYALACYYFFDSILVLFLCALIALIVCIRYFPKDANLCYSCAQENKNA